MSRSPFDRLDEVEVSRRTLLAATGAAAVFGLVPGVFGQQKTPAKRVVEEKSLQAGDATIALTYYKSTKEKDAPAVILLHNERSNRLVWTGDKPSFAERLNDEGYAVAAVDLRKHGQAAGGKAADPKLKAGDYQNMVDFDLPAVKQFLVDEHEKGNLNVRKTAIVAPGFSSVVALNFAANDWARMPWDDAPVFEARTPRGQDIRAMIFLSPEASVTGMNTGKAVSFLKSVSPRVATCICVGSKDKLDKGHEARKLHDSFAGTDKEKETEYNLFVEYDTNARGTQLLGKKLKVEELMLGFLKKYVADLPDQWATRKSRLDT